MLQTATLLLATLQGKPVRNDDSPEIVNLRRARSLIDTVKADIQGIETKGIADYVGKKTNDGGGNLVAITTANMQKQFVTYLLKDLDDQNTKMDGWLNDLQHDP